MPLRITIRLLNPRQGSSSTPPASSTQDTNLNGAHDSRPSSSYLTKQMRSQHYLYLLLLALAASECSKLERPWLPLSVALQTVSVKARNELLARD